MSRRRQSVTKSKNFQWTTTENPDEIADSLVESSVPSLKLTAGQRKKIRSQVAAPEQSTRSKEREFKHALSENLQDEGVNPKRRIWNFKAGDVVVLKRNYTHYDYSTTSKYIVIPSGSVMIIVGESTLEHWSNSHNSTDGDIMSCMWEGKIFNIWSSHFKIPDDFFDE